MSTKKMLVFATLLVAAVLLTACGGAEGPTGPTGPEGPEGPVGAEGVSAPSVDLTCTECHNDTDVITGKTTAWAESAHGNGEAYVRGTSASCAGCHSGDAFSERVAAGLSFGDLEAGDPDPTRQDCRACHSIHTSFTGDDWALTTTDAVNIAVLEGETFDGGKGNLCASCHQPRRLMNPAADGMVEITSTHWGPHYGTEATMLLGIGAAGDIEGKPSGHATMVEDTCVSCHLGEGQNHSFEPNVAACQACHADLENFDNNGLQTKVDELAAELLAHLVTAGLLDEGAHPIPGSYPEAQAEAAWNYIFAMYDDTSRGVHNPAYTVAILEAGLAVFE